MLVRIFFLLLLLPLANVLPAQSADTRVSEKRNLSPFDRVEIHPHIDVILKQGPQPQVHLQSDKRMGLEDVITEVKNHTLEVYIKGHQNSDRKSRFPYSPVKVVVYYQDLSRVDLQGDGYLYGGDPITNRSFELNLHGSNEVKLQELQLEEFQASLFGEGTLDIASGNATEQVIRVFGSSKIFAEGLESRHGKLNVFGEASIQVFVTESLEVSTFGDSEIRCKGNPTIDRHRTFGQSSISVIRP